VLRGAALSLILAVSTVSSAPFARSLRTQLTQRTGVPVTLVSCPARVPLRRGAVFTCRVRFTSHDRTPVRVRLTDAHGRYSAHLRDVLVRHLERQLDHARRADAPFRCPARRAVRRGDRFTCPGRGAVAAITQLGDGRVTYAFAR